MRLLIAALLLLSTCPGIAGDESTTGAIVRPHVDESMPVEPIPPSAPRAQIFPEMPDLTESLLQSASKGVVEVQSEPIGISNRPSRRGVGVVTVGLSDGSIVMTSASSVLGYRKIFVKTSSGRFPAAVVESDLECDCAFLWVEKVELPMLPTGYSTGVKVGDRVYMMNTDKKTYRVTVGEKIARRFDQVFYLDAKIPEYGLATFDDHGGFVGFASSRLGTRSDRAALNTNDTIERHTKAIRSLIHTAYNANTGWVGSMNNIGDQAWAYINWAKETKLRTGDTVFATLMNMKELVGSTSNDPSGRWSAFSRNLTQAYIHKKVPEDLFKKNVASPPPTPSFNLECQFDLSNGTKSQVYLTPIEPDKALANNRLAIINDKEIVWRVNSVQYTVNRYTGSITGIDVEDLLLPSGKPYTSNGKCTLIKDRKF